MEHTPQQASPPARQSELPRLLPFLAILLLVLGGASIRTTGVQALLPVQGTATLTPSPTPTFDVQRLARPVLDPGYAQQVHEGSVLYWGVCMACHGDRGQGLTEEWRDAYGEHDRNCWQKGCHGPDHPDNGFLIPKEMIIPSVAGPGRLTRFKNAQELHDFILASMPWWDPGQLSDEEAWQATAFILKLHQVMPLDFVLSERNGSAIPTQHAVPQPREDRPAVLALIALLALAAVGLVVQDLQKKQPGWFDKPNFFHHLHPPTVPALQARLRYTLGAGGLAVFLCLVLLVTGILEMFYYIPVPEHAAASIETITSLVPFGDLVRNLHFWSAQALLIVITVHLLRVVLTGAYARHRRLNYLIGLGMFVLVILLNFTGYVLRWDEGIRWALIVGTNLLKSIPWMGPSLYQVVVGGPEPGLSAVERFYTWHIFVLTLATIALGIWHIFRVRRDGGIAVPPPAMRADQARITRFELVRHEVLVMVIAGVILLVISSFFPAPIERPITQAIVDIENAKAPWFFLWVQQLLKWGDPFLWGVAIPILLLVTLSLLPWLLPVVEEQEYGRWFPAGNRLAQLLLLAILLAVLFLTILASLPAPQL